MKLLLRLSYLIGRAHVITSRKTPALFCSCRHLNSGQLTQALRPFYFAVHPDLFGQYPEERAVNENSLKLLNAYLDAALLRLHVKPFTLVFYIRKQQRKTDEFTEVRIQITKNVRNTITEILQSCNLDTAYVNSIPDQPEPSIVWPSMSSRWGPFQGFEFDFEESPFDEDHAHRMYGFTKEPEEETLRSWLKNNIKESESRLEACQPVRDEILRLRQKLCQELGLKSILWECGWNTLHFRGTLQSFRGLAKQNPQDMKILKGRSILFGPETGISLAGHVMLYSGEIRNNWLDFIKKVSDYNSYLRSIPLLQQSLSGVLRGVRIRHRRSQNTILAQDYARQLRRLLTALHDHFGTTKIPSDWPNSLEHLQIIVEGEGGPLMILPSGQILLPSDCLPSSFVKFMSENMNKAHQRFKSYQGHRVKEQKLWNECMLTIGLNDLEKDEIVTADRMVKFLESLLKQEAAMKMLLNARVIVTTYYSVLPDGAICIPWNFKT